ncbi:MAG: LmeA family phospholipid-binding protein [Gordonia sp. (in: high G+C Gram-positive bacteria)]|uniref:LmeA family phospholipid-binding protein n=1 Tax=Gordonia sp. (in: high G+C Gram-positive bacteria) TaxID=84139 RepID=UPI0039E3A9F5
MTNDDEWTSADEPATRPTPTGGPTAKMPTGGDAPAGAPTPDPSAGEPTVNLSPGAATAQIPPQPTRQMPAGYHPGSVTKTAPRAATGGGRGPKKKRNLKAWVAFGAAAVVLLAGIGVVGGEFYTRNKVTSCLSKAFGSLTGSPTTVRLDSKPVLLQAWNKQIPFVQVDSSGGDTDGKLNLRVDDIRSSGNTSTIRKIEGSGVVPYEQILQSTRDGGGMLNTPQGGADAPGQIEKITSNGDGTFDVTATVTAMIIPIPATVTVKPSVRDGKPHFEVKEATALVVKLPPEWAQGIVDDITASTLGPTLRNLTLTKLTAESNGIAFAVSGDNISVDENLVRPRGDCSNITTAVSGG